MEFIVTIQEPEVQVVTVASQGEQGIAGLIWIDAGWSSGVDYVVDNALEHNGSSYRVFVAHTSSAANEPGVGVDWETVWKVLAEKGNPGTDAITQTREFGITVDGAGSIILTGEKGVRPITFDQIITGWKLNSDQQGSVVVDVLNNGVSITGATKPTLVNEFKETGDASDWTKSLDIDDEVSFVVESITDLTWFSLIITSVQVA